MKVIAECGVNWLVDNGFKPLENAKLMILEAKNVGCWAAKFQLFNEGIVKETVDGMIKDVKTRGMRNYLEYEYTKQLRRGILSKEEAKELFEYGEKEGINVFFTPMFLEAVDWCEDIGVKYYKIRFKDNQNRDLIYKIQDTGKKFFISTRNHDGEDCLGYSLYCVPEYPAKLMDYYEIFSTGFYDVEGISDHTSCTCLLQIALYENLEDIRYFEKHVKLDGSIPIEDKWSVSFKELEEVLKEYE